MQSYVEQFQGITFSAPKKTPFLGHLPLLFRGRNGCLYDSLRQIASVGPGIYSLQIGQQSWHLVSDAKLAKEMLAGLKPRFPKGATLDEFKAFGLAATGLTFSEGEEWVKQRRILQPFFNPSAVDHRTNVTALAIDSVVAKIATGIPLDLEKLGARASLQLTLGLLHGKHGLPGSTEENDKVIEGIIERQNFASQQIIKRMTYGSWWKKLPIPSNFRVRRDTKVHSDLLASWLKIHRDRAEGDSENGSFISFLLSSQEESALGAQHLVDQLQTFLGAAYESTASSIQWLLFHLAQRLDLQEAISREAKESNFETSKMPVTTRVVQEVLRLHPAFSLLVRSVGEASAGKDGPMKPGDSVFFLLELMQTKRDIWGPDADKFRPERFEPQTISPEQMASYVPFGIGARYCIGNHQGLKSLVLLAAAMCNSFVISPIGEMSDERVFRVTMRPLRPLRVMFKSRN